MKKTLLMTSVLLMSLAALAGEPKATLCREEAIQGATAIFKLNQKEEGQLSYSTNLIDMDHSEGGTEVWDVNFKKNNLEYAPYRITVSVDDCMIIGFSIQ